MSERDNHVQTDDLTTLHTFFVKNTVKAAKNLNNLRKSSSPEAQSDFKSAVSGLTQFYFRKFGKADGVEEPDLFEEVDNPPDMNKESVETCKNVFFRIMEVQEELGHTTIEEVKPGRRNV
jgi:hypothetical protein